MEGGIADAARIKRRAIRRECRSTQGKRPPKAPARKARSQESEEKIGISHIYHATYGQALVCGKSRVTTSTTERKI